LFSVWWNFWYLYWLGGESCFATEKVKVPKSVNVRWVLHRHFVKDN
jgi:hypothetical protein